MTTQYFKTVADMAAVPAEKIDAFCEDLRLWLHVHKCLARIEQDTNVRVVSETDTFGWIDDGKHDVSVTVQDHDGNPIEEVKL